MIKRYTKVDPRSQHSTEVSRSIEYTSLQKYRKNNSDRNTYIYSYTLQERFAVITLLIPDESIHLYLTR